MRVSGVPGRPIRVALFLAVLHVVGVDVSAEEAVRRGAYLTAAGGCFVCHTDLKKKGPPFAGGAALKTPFGVFHAPNITPDARYGIGAWSDRDFIRAMREGVSPEGEHYFPAFPYAAYAGISDRDLLAILAYLRTQKPVARAGRPHAVRFPFSWRFLVTFWKLLYFKPSAFQPDPSKLTAWNRGAYLVTSLSHCGECHTPRTPLGGLDRARLFTGVDKGAYGDSVPNITPGMKSGIGRWSDDEIATYLQTGMDRDGDFAGSLMADVIEYSTGRLSDADIAAIIHYLRSPLTVTNSPADQNRN